MSRAGVVIVLMTLTLASCDGGGQGSDAIPGGQKVADLIAAGSCPVQVVGVKKGTDGFVLKLMNRSDSPVGSVRWGAVALDGSGQPLLDGASEAGYEGEPIAPWQTIEVELPLPQEKAASARVVIKSLIRYTPDPVNTGSPAQPHVWRNPMYDIQLHGAQGIPAEE